MISRERLEDEINIREKNRKGRYSSLAIMTKEIRTSNGLAPMVGLSALTGGSQTDSRTVDQGERLRAHQKQPKVDPNHNTSGALGKIVLGPSFLPFLFFFFSISCQR